MVFKMIFRSWMRRPLNTFISIISLMIGLTCSVLLLLFYLSERQVAKSMIKEENVQVMMSQEGDDPNQAVYTPNIGCRQVSALAETFPEIENLSLVTFAEAEFLLPGSATRYRDRGYCLATPSLANLIRIPVKKGNLYQTLSNKNELAVTPALAMKLFGTPDALGRSIEISTFTHSFETVKETFTVTTLLDDNRKQLLNCVALSGMSPEFVAQSRSSQLSSFFAFLQLKQGNTPEQFISKIKADTAFYKKNFASGKEIALQPLQNIYFASESNSDFSVSIFNTREPFTLFVGLAISLVVLLIAAFNYVNITLTRANDRLKSIAGQRIMGATPGKVRWQTVLDTGMQVMLAFLFSLLLIKGCIPVFNSFMGADLALADLFRVEFALAIGGLLCGLILIPSGYILVKLEVSRPLEMFMKQHSQRVGTARNMLIVQFAIATVLIVMGLNIARQTRFICSTVPQADRFLVVSPVDQIESENPDELGLPLAYVDYIRNLASVNGVLPGSLLSMGMVNSGNYSLSRLYTTPEYFDFFGLKLTEGRTFSQTENSQNVIVNEALLRKLELRSPYVGQTFEFRGEKQTIIGVVEDFRYSNVKDAVEPLAIWPYGEHLRRLMPEQTIRFSGSEKEMRKLLAAKWSELYPQRPQPAVTRLDVAIMDRNTEVNRMGVLVTVFTTISVILAFLGLFGIAWYMVLRRRQEIGLRKIHGATASQVIQLLCTSFFIWTGIAMLMALPVAYYLSGYWLEGFTYRIANSVWIILFTALLMALLTFLTVIWQSWQAALENPANSIKAQ